MVPKPSLVKRKTTAHTHTHTHTSSCTHRDFGCHQQAFIFHLLVHTFSSPFNPPSSCCSSSHLPCGRSAMHHAHPSAASCSRKTQCAVHVLPVAWTSLHTLPLVGSAVVSARTSSSPSSYSSPCTPWLSLRGDAPDAVARDRGLRVLGSLLHYFVVVLQCFDLTATRTTTRSETADSHARTWARPLLLLTMHILHSTYLCLKSHAHVSSSHNLHLHRVNKTSLRLSVEVMHMPPPAKTFTSSDSFIPRLFRCPLLANDPDLRIPPLVSFLPSFASIYRYT